VAPDGSFAATWESGTYGTNDYDMFARRFAADGTPMTADLPVNTYTTGLQAYGSVAVDHLVCMDDHVDHDWLGRRRRTDRQRLGRKD